MLNISSCIYGPFLPLFETVPSICLPNFNWIICSFRVQFFNSLYILVINPYLINSWQGFFSNSVDCLFSLVIVSFAVQKKFQFDEIPLVDSYSNFLNYWTLSYSERCCLSLNLQLPDILSSA
jgi:hypothetical protein